MTAEEQVKQFVQDMARAREEQRKTKAEAPPSQPGSRRGYWELEGFVPADSPRFPEGALIDQRLLDDYPQAEGGTRWRKVCDLLTCRRPKATKRQFVSRFLNLVAAEVRQLALEWSAAREKEKAATGRLEGDDGWKVGEQVLFEGDDWCKVGEQVLSCTAENVSTLLLRIHEQAKASVDRDRNDSLRYYATASLEGAVGTLLSMCVAKEHLLCDFGMTSFLRRTLLPTIRLLNEGRLIRCTNCGRIEKPARSWQKLCRKCKGIPGIRQKAWRRQASRPTR